MTENHGAGHEALEAEIEKLSQRVGVVSARLGEHGNTLDRHANRLADLEGKAHTHEAPPIDPPVEPPDETVVDVPVGATRIWLIDQYNLGKRTFRHQHDWAGKGPLPGADGIKHVGVPVAAVEVVGATPSGIEIHRRSAPTNTPKLTISIDESAIAPVSARPKNVTLQGFEITGNSRDFGVPDDGGDRQQGIVDGELFDGLKVLDNHIHHNDGTGVRIGPSIEIRDNLIHHNDHLGIGGAHRGGLPVIANNELYQNTQGAGSNHRWEGGEIKVTKGHQQERYGLITENYVHDGDSKGIWIDIDGGWDITSNLVEEQKVIGIFYEAGQAGRAIKMIQDNLCRQNGYEGASGVWDAMEANIVVSEQALVLVQGNEVHMASRRENGIVLKQQKRFDHHRRTGEWMYTDHVTLEGNTVTRVDGNGNRGIRYIDDTNSHNESQGFIKNFLRNRNRDDIPEERRATIHELENDLP